jgi:hypothetical protein
MTRVVVVLLVSAGILAGAARASDGDVRARGTCTGASSVTLRLRAEDSRIRLELELRSARRGALWRLVVLHERRLVARVSLPAPAGGEALRVRRSFADWFGTDAFVVRASRSGETCSVRAVI